MQAKTIFAPAGPSAFAGSALGARYVVAVHPDPDAPILKQADIAIVGDPAKFARELAELLE